LERLLLVSQEYRGSEAEAADLKAAYLLHKGDMNGIFERVMLSSVLDDEERFRSTIQAWIDAKEVPAFQAFTDEPSRKRAARKRNAMREAKQAAVAEADLNAAAAAAAAAAHAPAAAAAAHAPAAAAAAAAATQKPPKKKTLKNAAPRPGQGPDVVSELQKRFPRREQAFERFAEKYTNGRAKPESEPTEEEFQRIQAELTRRSKAAKRH
jgi:DnaJ family protein C protein 9